MNSIILLGSGGHCKSCIDVIEKSSSHKIKGIIDKPKKGKKEFMGYKILGNDNQLENHFQENVYLNFFLKSFLNLSHSFDNQYES